MAQPGSFWHHGLESEDPGKFVLNLFLKIERKLLICSGTLLLASFFFSPVSERSLLKRLRGILHKSPSRDDEETKAFDLVVWFLAKAITHHLFSL